MAEPISPVIPGCDLPETIFGAGQPEYNGLPALRMEDGTVLSRWRFTWGERLRILFTGDLYLWVLTFNRPLQPVNLEVTKPIKK